MIQFYNQVRYKDVVQLNHIIWDEHKVLAMLSFLLWNKVICKVDLKTCIVSLWNAKSWKIKRLAKYGYSIIY